MTDNKTIQHSSIPVRAIIARCDELCSSGKIAENGEFLRQWYQKAADCGDESGKLSIVNELLGHYRLTGDLQTGLSMVGEALKLLDKLEQNDTVSGGTVLLNAATVLQAAGRNDQAEKCYYAALHAYKKHLEEDDLHFAGLYNNMASVYMAKNEFRTAEDFYLNALDILNMYGKVMDCATAYVNLAQLAVRRALPPDMVHAYLDCAMQCFNNPSVPRNGYYAHTCGKCAEVFFMAGRAGDGEELLIRMEEIHAAN